MLAVLLCHRTLHSIIPTSPEMEKTKQKKITHRLYPPKKTRKNLPAHEKKMLIGFDGYRVIYSTISLPVNRLQIWPFLACGVWHSDLGGL